MVKRIVLGVLGVVLGIGWLALKSRLRPGEPAVAEGTLPTKVFEGGAPVVVEADCSADCVLDVSFEAADPSGTTPRHLSAWQRLPAGAHAFPIDVPPGLGGSIEVRMDSPSVGATLKARLRTGGEVRAEDVQTLGEPLKPGYAFAADLDVEDFAAGKAAAP